MSATRLDVLALCVQRGGYRKGRKVAQFIMEWELAVRDARREITVQDFADYWREHLATPYRRLVEFRELFPEFGEHGKPSDLMGPLLEQLRSKPAEDVGDVPLVVPG